MFGIGFSIWKPGDFYREVWVSDFIWKLRLATWHIPNSSPHNQQSVGDELWWLSLRGDESPSLFHVPACSMRPPQVLATLSLDIRLNGLMNKCVSFLCGIEKFGGCIRTLQCVWLWQGTVVPCTPMTKKEMLPPRKAICLAEKAALAAAHQK